MRLDVGSVPDLSYLPLRDAGVARHQPGAPMRRLDGRPFGGQKQNALDGPAVECRPGAAGTVLAEYRRTGPAHIRLSTVGRAERGRSTNPSEPIGTVPAVPQMHGRPADVQQSSRFRGAAAPVEREQDARPPGLTARRRRPSQPPFQGLPVPPGAIESPWLSACIRQYQVSVTSTSIWRTVH